MRLAFPLRRWVAALFILLALSGGYWYYTYSSRLIRVGEVRIDPLATIDPEREYRLVVWEHEVPLPWDQGAHREALTQAIEEFRSVWPNVTVDLQVIPWHADHARLREALASGTPPDVYGMPMGARLIDPRLQIPVHPYLSPEAKDDLLPSAVASLSDEAGLWAWPKWVQPQLWVVREDLTPALERGRSHWTKGELLSALKEAKEHSGDAPLVLNPFDASAFFEVMVASTGKNPIGRDGSREWSVDEIAHGLAFFQELIAQGLTGRDAAAMARRRLAQFWNRRAAMIGPVNPWLLRHLMTRGGVVDDGAGPEGSASHLALAVPPPTFLDASSRARLPAVISGYVVFRQQAYQGDDHTRAAMALAEHLSRRLGPWEAAHLFAVPAHPSAWPAWRDDAGLPAKELDLLVEWARSAIGPPLRDAFAHVQDRAIETVLATSFPKLWEGQEPRALAEEIAAGIDGLRAVVKLP
ncbi:MAG TPA: ABC transporter substrate-binding protein [Limnochordia bacterium]|nr:ABC transporter substrate-binding protein [Limnochordia bacterium]